MTRDWKSIKEALGPTENIVVTGPPCSGKTTVALGLFNTLSNEIDRDGETTKWAVRLMSGAVVEGGRKALSPDIVIWDRTPPPAVMRNLTTRFITCSAII